MKKRLYSSRVPDIEQGTFTPLVLTTTNAGMGRQCLRCHSRLAELIATKKGEQYKLQCLCSPVILWKKIGQPATNCNRRFFNGFRLCNVSLLTYQKSQKIPLREVTKKRDLL